MFPRTGRISVCLAAFSIFLTLSAVGRAALFSSTAQSYVRASLVALDESIQPGKPVIVALRLEHEPHWHTYWINPGTGYPTSLEWSLPEGWQAGEIQWPVPSIIRDRQGNMTGNGYEGIVYLPVTLVAPANLAPGSQVTLKAKADWLMCADSCVPGNADVSLTLPVAAGAPKAYALRDSVLASPPMPQKPDGASVAATRAAGAKSVTLVISPNPAGGSGGVLHFFSLDGLIQYDQPQTALAGGKSLTLTLPVSDSYDGEGKRLTGVLAFTDAKGVYRGFEIDVELGAVPAQPEALAHAQGRDARAASGGSGISASILLLAFVGGLILNLMPCVFPVLGIKILGFVNQAGASRRKVTMHGIAFAIGVLVSFWTLAGLLAVLRAGGDQLGWGFQLQSPVFVFVLAAVMLVFAMSMSGVFEFGLSATSVGSNLQTKSGYTGSFFTGVLATVVATPCSAPFLAPALGAALAISTGESFLVFTAIALGLAMPYLLLSIFPGAVKILPRPGAWMETFKQVMAFLLYASAGALLWVLAAQTQESDYGLLWVIFGFVIVAMAAWVHGRFAQGAGSPRRRMFGLVAAPVLFIAGIWLGWPASHDASPAKSTSSQNQDAPAVTWEKWSPAAVAAARAAGKPIYVDFTARWCATCQTNKLLVFKSEEVLRYFHEHGVVALRADWTSRNPEITAELARFGRSAVPFNLIYKPGQAEPVVLPELLTPGIVLDALK